MDNEEKYFENKKYYYAIKRVDDDDDDDFNYVEMCVTPYDYYQECGYVWDDGYPDDFYDAIGDISGFCEEAESYFQTSKLDMSNEEFEAKMAERGFTMICDEGFTKLALGN